MSEHGFKFLEIAGAPCPVYLREPFGMDCASADRGPVDHGLTLGEACLLREQLSAILDPILASQQAKPMRKRYYLREIGSNVFHVMDSHTGRPVISNNDPSALSQPLTIYDRDDALAALKFWNIHEKLCPEATSRIIGNEPPPGSETQ